jgi:hypothetical protein
MEKDLYNMIRMSIVDVLDRYIIASLKMLRVDKNQFKHEVDTLYAEFSNYSGEKRQAIKDFGVRLQRVHEGIWSMEASIRQAQEDELGLEEVGRRALKVRDLNRERQTIKNEMIDYFGEGQRDCKCNYAGGK